MWWRGAGFRRWRRLVVTALVGLLGGAVVVAVDHSAARGAVIGAWTDLVPGSTAAVPAGSAGCRPGADSVVSAPDPSASDGHRAVWVHRPAGVDDATVPVLYLLHGYPGDPADVAAGDLPGLLDRQMCRTGRPFVVAAPDGRAGDTDTEWGDDAGGSFAIERFVTTTAVALVEGAERRAPALRAIGGFSMGGYGATVLALRHPDLYTQVAAFAGYYHADDPDGVFDDDAAHAPDRLVAPGSGQRYFLVEGADEDTALMRGSVRGEADRFAVLLRRAGVTVAVSHPDGGHSYGVWYSQSAAMVTFLTVGWAAGTARTR
jgi:S-formylglutathione hydrolase FrmB